MPLAIMGWIRDYLLTLRLPLRALVVTLAVMLILTVIGIFMGCGCATRSSRARWRACWGRRQPFSSAIM